MFEAVVHGIFLLLGLITVGCVLLITVYLIISGIPAIQKIGLVPFLTGKVWSSTSAEPKYGILPFILTSVYGTAGAIVLGVPIGFLTAVYLSKVAPKKVRTVLEAAAMANSLILNLYDWQDAGSLGLLWRADNGRGNVLYLLGSIHTDRNNLYPFHKQLRDVILNAEQVSFELDFNDTDQLLEFAAMQTYPAGDSLANHISPALYQAVVQATAQLGMDEGTVSQYKPWALANSFSSLATLDETSSENAMAIDLYVNAKAINAGIDIGAVETYAFQGQIFDTLSPEYQEQYLASGLLLILDPDSISQETRDALTQVLGEDAFQPATQEAIQAQLDQISAMMDSWKARDAAEFDAVYGKDAILDSEDELNQKLFTGRDPGMIQYAADYLSQPGSHTGLLVVGAGHMVGDTGVVQGLRDLGYTVELVPVP